MICQHLGHNHGNKNAVHLGGGIDIMKYQIKEVPSEDGKKKELPRCFKWCPTSADCLWLNTA